MTALITLLTDYGTRDPWVAICKGVILGIAPDVRLLDLTHDIDNFDVRGGTQALADSLPSMPIGFHMAVVDPGVGTERRAMGVRARRGDVLVGPDNGLLLPAAEALGGVVVAHELREARYRHAAPGRTFDGRDVFAPAAAHLAMGVPLEEFGPSISTSDLVALDLPGARRMSRFLQAGVLAIDTFGNVDLAGSRADLEGVMGPLHAGQELLLAWWVEGAEARERVAPWADAFGDVGPGEVLVYENALGRVAVAVNQGSAADTLRMRPGATVNVGRHG